MKLLVGLYAPTSGVITIDDVPINELRYNRVRRQIGFVTQDTQLFSGTIRENLQLVKPDATDEEMLERPGQASAGPLLERSAEGLDTLLGEGGLRVSGGERQRLSIARALLRHPRLLIFDEATSSLDSITERGDHRPRCASVSGSRQHMVTPDRPPAQHDRARRHDLRPRARPHRRDGQPRRAGRDSRASTTPCGASRSASASRAYSAAPAVPVPANAGDTASAAGEEDGP